jgi:hypothetical protein
LYYSKGRRFISNKQLSYLREEKEKKGEKKVIFEKIKNYFPL